MQYTPAQVAQMVINQGGSKAQAWVAAALVDGIESNGQTTDKNPNSTACGLFQFLTTTWASDGGTAYAPTACGATGEQQVAIFLKASAGSNFYAWAPDMGGTYNGNNKQPAATTPQTESPVANKIASLAAGGTLGFLGNVPQNWASAGAATATTGIGSLIPGGGSSSSATSSSSCALSISFGVLGKVCFLSSSQIKALSGAAAILAGGVLGVFGVIMVAGAIGQRTGATGAVKSAPNPFRSSTKSGRPKVTHPTSQPRAVNKILSGPKKGAGDIDKGAPDPEKLAYQRGMFAGQGGSARPRDYARTTGNPRPPSGGMVRRTNGGRGGPSVTKAKKSRIASVAKDGDELAAF